MGEIVELPGKPLQPRPEHLEIAQTMLAAADAGQIQVSWVHAVAMAMTTEYERGCAWLLARLAVCEAALVEAEACMSIVEPRSDKVEYLRILGVIRAALKEPDNV